MHGPIHIKFTIPKFLKQCLFILLVKTGWKQGKARGIKAGNSVVESVRLGLCAIGNNLDIWAKICVSRETFGRNFNLVERAAFWRIFSG